MKKYKKTRDSLDDESIKLEAKIKKATREFHSFAEQNFINYIFEKRAIANHLKNEADRTIRDLAEAFKKQVIEIEAATREKIRVTEEEREVIDYVCVKKKLVEFDQYNLISFQYAATVAHMFANFKTTM